MEARKGGKWAKGRDTQIFSDPRLCTHTYLHVPLHYTKVVTSQCTNYHTVPIYQSALYWFQSTIQLCLENRFTKVPSVIHWYRHPGC